MPKPKFPKPWYRKRRGWYVTLGGEQIPLGKGKEAAFEQYHELMRRPLERRKAPAGSMLSVIDQFLEWVEKHRAPDTYVWYQSRLQLFARRYPDLTVRDLRPFHVQQWIDGYDFSSGSKRNYARAVVRCMNWAEEQGLVERSPLAHFKKPRAGIRETVIAPEEYEDILAAIRNPDFADLCTVAWETGARAAECLAIEKRHVDLARQRIVFPVCEEKMERAPRII